MYATYIATDPIMKDLNLCLHPSSNAYNIHANFTAAHISC